MSNEATDSPRETLDQGVETTAAAEGAAPSAEAAAAAAAAPTPEELAALREQAAQAEALKDRYLRAVAEFENFRKRAARERQEAAQFASQGLMEKLLPALDNMDLALAAAASAEGSAAESLKTGVDMVLGQLRSVLREAGLEEIDAMGQAFDPAWHEAVSQQETVDVPEGQVVQQLRKGYRLHQRLLRPAMVVVARSPQG